MAVKQYNPYGDLKAVVGYKADWHTAKQLGQDPDQYYHAAAPHYKNMVDNGYEGLAQQLSDMDYIQAKGLLGNYKPDDEIEFNNYVDGMTGQGSPTVQDNARAYGADPSTQKLLDMAVGAGQEYQNFQNQARDIATGAVSTQPSDTVNNMLGAWQSGNDRLNGAIRYDENGNVISGLNTEHYNIGRNQLDYINNFDVTKQPYYQGIMDQYKLGGYNAAQGAYADGSANNGGNIDSYAAANANRQQLAFTTAGQQAALAAAQQNANNWQNLYSQMSQDLNNQGKINADTLAQAAYMYNTDAEERMSALDVAGAMERQRMANAINGYLGNIQADMEKYNIDAQTAMNRENNQAAYDQLIKTLESNKDIQMIIGNTQRDVAGINANAQLGVAGINADASRDVANIQGQTQLGVAGIQGNTQLGVAGMQRDATLGAAQIGANATLGAAQIGYQQRMAELQNGLDQLVTAGQINREQSQWMMDQAVKNGWIPQGYTAATTGTTPNGNEKLTYDEVIDLAAYLFRNGTPEELNEYGLGGVTNMAGLTEWFQSYLGNRTDAAKAAKAITDKNTGYPNAIEDIQKILKDYNSTAPVYSTTRSNRTQISMN